MSGNTKSAPNRIILPPKVSTDSGIRSNIKQLPKELLTRNQQKAVLPYLSAPRILSKAEKDATAWYHRHKELEESDLYQERIRVQLNLPETGTPLRAKEVRVVNLDEMASKIERGINDGVAPRPPPPPQLPPAVPPSRRGGRSGTQTDDIAQINPLTRELSTTSTQTMRQMADAATSAVPNTATGSTQTDMEPQTGGPLTMALDPPLQQIVHNHNIVQQHHNQHTSNVVNQLNQEFNYNNYIYNQTMMNVDASRNTVNNLLQQNLTIQAVDNLPTADRNLPVAQDTIMYDAPGRVTMPNRLMIEAPQGQPVAPARLPVPAAAPRRRNSDALPAYGDLDLNFGEANPPPAYGGGLLVNQNRGRPRVNNYRRGVAQTAARILQNQRRPDNRIVQLPAIPEAHRYDVRPAGVPEVRIRDEGWYAQGIEPAPKPPTKRKGARLVKDVTPKRRRLA